MQFSMGFPRLWAGCGKLLTWSVKKFSTLAEALGVRVRLYQINDLIVLLYDGLMFLIKVSL